jgi:hypothetical protein
MRARAERRWHELDSALKAKQHAREQRGALGLIILYDLGLRVMARANCDRGPVLAALALGGVNMQLCARQPERPGSRKQNQVQEIFIEEYRGRRKKRSASRRQGCAAQCYSE